MTRARLFSLLLFAAAACSSTRDDAETPNVPDGDGSVTPAVVDDAGGPREEVDAAPPPGPLSPSYVDFDINHVLLTGQSNSVGNSATPVLSTTQPFSNLMFDTGVMTSGACDGDGCKVYQTPSSLVPLVEGDMFFDYPVETPASGWANEISRLARDVFELGSRAGYPAKHDVLVSVHGRSGNPYLCLRKGGCAKWWERGYLWPFDEAMSQVASAKALAAARGRSHVVRAVATVHGETDHYAPNTPHAGTDGTPNAIQSYADALIEWQRDYESGIKAITGQTEPVPLFVTGLSGWTDVEVSQIPLDQLAAHIAAPGKVVLVGPTYQLEASTDCVHFTEHGERHLGEYLAKVYAKVVLGGEKWEPLRPKAITRSGAVITVEYFVPSPPLVVDTERVAAAQDLGFKVLKDGTPLSIASVTIVEPDKVRITLASEPSPGGLVLRYGMQTLDGTQCIGPTKGPRGNIRDSDATPSQHGYDLFNWSVQFQQAIP